MYRLPVRHRQRFRKPFGVLHADLQLVLPQIANRVIYTVGDVVTRNLIMEGISPKIAIIDGFTMRVPCPNTPILLAPRRVVANPAGMISEDLIAVINEAVQNPPVLIFVEGEEDLAVIPLVMAAPPGTVVLYGQPGEGVVVREVNERAKETAKEMFALFERADDP
jgi:uncharacterized protein (UPF0218 family)